MSVGHIAREMESRGIPTVAVFVQAFRHVAIDMGLPRVVVTQHPMGRPIGAPGDTAKHREVVSAALQLLGTATEGGTIITHAAPYRPAPD